jgi:hypothetical protein
MAAPGKIVSYELVPDKVFEFNGESVHSKSHILALDDKGKLWLCAYKENLKWQCLNLPG